MIIFDYIDAHVPTLERMYHKRLRAYRQIGFEICANLQAAQEEKTGTIFDAQTYTPVYERDLQAAQREILISSPALSRKKHRGSVPRRKKVGSLAYQIRHLKIPGSGKKKPMLAKTEQQYKDHALAWPAGAI